MAKTLKEMGITAYDLLVLTALLETTWWAMFTLLEVGEHGHILGITQGYFKLSCIERLLLAIIIIWYGTIANGKSYLLFLYVMISFMADVRLWLDYYTTIQLHLSEKHCASYWFWLSTAVFIAFRCLIQSNIGAFVRDTNALDKITVDLNDRDCFYGKGISNVVKYYSNHLYQVTFIIIVWERIWLYFMLALQLPEYIFGYHTGLLGQMENTKLVDVILSLFRLASVLLSFEVVYRGKVRKWLTDLCVMYSFVLQLATVAAFYICINAHHFQNPMVYLINWIYFVPCAMARFGAWRFFHYFALLILRLQDSGIANERLYYPQFNIQRRRRNKIGRRNRG